VVDGSFREDLLYRLNTVEIALPPLRDRKEDIPALALHFLRRETAHYGKELVGFTREAMDALVRHPWPGNVRELAHAVERSVLMARDDRVGVGDLGLRRREDGNVPLEQMTLEEAEGVLVERALARFDGNVSRAAEALGLSRSALYRRLQRHDRSP
jgi:DNA-binding NtrC family response regulator